MYDTKKLSLRGESILGVARNFSIKIKEETEALFYEEETALMNSIEEKLGMLRLPYLAQLGLLSCPTIINDVETLAKVPSIISKDPSWFAFMGTKKVREQKYSLGLKR